MFGKKRKEIKELSDEEKAFLLNEYGTTDKDEIYKMSKALSDYDAQLRYQNFDLKYKGLDSKEHMTLVHLIASRHRIAARERHALKMPSGSKTPTPSEEIINDLDKLILLNQMAKKGYSNEQSEAIYNLINKKYRITTCDLLSIDFDHYNVDKTLNVTIKSTKERYAIMILKQEKNKDLEI